MCEGMFVPTGTCQGNASCLQRSIQAEMNESVHTVGSMFHFWCPVPVQVRTNEQTYREAYRSAVIARYQTFFTPVRGVTVIGDWFDWD